MSKKIIPLFSLENGKPLFVTNEAVAAILLKKKDIKGNALYTEKESEAAPVAKKIKEEKAAKLAEANKKKK